MMKVQYSVSLLKPGTNTTLPSLKVGQEGDIAVFVRDLRPRGTFVDWKGMTRSLVRGVFAAYCDLNFTYKQVQVVAGSFKFGPAYPNGIMSHEAKGVYNDTGAFAQSFSGLGIAPCELFRFCVKAVATGQATFACSFDVLPTVCDTLVYGNIAADPPEESHVDTDEIITTPLTFPVVTFFK